jgi:hypothetical protein
MLSVGSDVVGSAVGNSCCGVLCQPASELEVRLASVLHLVCVPLPYSSVYLVSEVQIERTWHSEQGGCGEKVQALPSLCIRP